MLPNIVFENFPVKINLAATSGIKNPKDGDFFEEEFKKKEDVNPSKKESKSFKINNPTAA